VQRFLAVNCVMYIVNRLISQVLNRFGQNTWREETTWKT
jgi:hypothetical protein